MTPTSDLQAANAALRAEIAERRRAEQELARLNRTLTTLYECDQALVRATTEDELLQEICRILVEVGGHRMAFVGYRELDAEKSVRVVARAGDAGRYFDRIRITWGDGETARGPTGVALRTGEPCWVRDVKLAPSFEPWRSAAIDSGINSCLALPLNENGKTFGALGLYHVEPDAFNERTLDEFAELAGNMAYGVTALRTRAERDRLERESRLAEESLRRANRELEHATRVTTMGELVASIAHEVNQPLAAIVTNGNAGLRWLAAAPPNLAEVRGAVERMIHDGNRASAVIGRIRDFLRKVEPRKERCSLNDIVNEVLALAHPELVKHGVRLATDLAEPLPPVFADRVQLQQVLLNLVVNGVEAMSPVPEGLRELAVSTAAAGGRVVVGVRDRGHGIAAADLPLVFEAFHTTKPHGLGMGLSIGRSIAEAHGGCLSVTSEAGAGTTFRLELPTVVPEP